MSKVKSFSYTLKSIFSLFEEKFIPLDTENTIYSEVESLTIEPDVLRFQQNPSFLSLDVIGIILLF